MKDSYVHELFAVLSADERKDVEVLLASPFFNAGKFAEGARALWSVLLRFNGAEDMDKQQFYSEVFPGQALIPGKIEKVMTHVRKLLWDYFLICRTLSSSEEFSGKLEIARLLHKRGLDNRSQLVINQLVNQQKESKRKDVSFYKQQYEIEFEIYSIDNQSNTKRDDINIGSTLVNLDLYYYLRRYELLNQLLLQQKISKLITSEYLQYTLEENVLPERLLNESPVLNITYRIFQLLHAESPTIADFEQILSLILISESEISENALQTFYGYLRNFCVLLIDGGERSLLPTLFELQKQHLLRGYLSKDGKIKYTAYISLTQTALLLKEYDWAIEFIESYRPHILGKTNTDDYYKLNLALYLVARQEFEKALDVLPFEIIDLDVQNLVRRLELKIYFELDSDLLPYKLDAFKMYLSRASQKILSARERDLHVNFVNLLTQIVQSTPGDPKRAERLRGRILEKKLVAERAWLLEKVNQMK